jgi:hypothetical protein
MAISATHAEELDWRVQTGILGTSFLKPHWVRFKNMIYDYSVRNAITVISTWEEMERYLLKICGSEREVSMFGESLKTVGSPQMPIFTTLT